MEKLTTINIPYTKIGGTIKEYNKVSVLFKKNGVLIGELPWIVICMIY